MEENLIEERKEKLVAYLKKSSVLGYALLILVGIIAIFIRTRNLSKLRDITTGGWTLGPDLDPFLFLRWAKYIVTHGKLMALDTMRFVPLGFNTKNEVLLHPYLIAWFHKVAILVGLSSSVEQSAVLFPVFMFALTVVAFFFFVRRVFATKMDKNSANIGAGIATLFLSIIPAILPRTIAGIPEKEASGFFFLFLAFYLFLAAWQTKKLSYKLSLSLLSAIATSFMAFTWGGYIYIYLTVGLAVFAAFIFGQVDKKQAYNVILWLIASFIIISTFSPRYSVTNLIESTATLVPLIAVAAICVHFIIFGTRLKNYVDPRTRKFPKTVVSLVITLVLGAIAVSIMFGPGFLVEKTIGSVKPLITSSTDRVGVTVAENKQPYFGEWASSFGPYVMKIPLFFWLFFIGSVYMFHSMVRSFAKKDRILMVLAYVFFLIAIIFSRYKGDSVLNGTNFASLSLYLLGVIALVGGAGYYYYKYYKKGESEKFREVDFAFMMVFAFFFLSLISARGAIRLVMMLVPPTSIIVSFFIVSIFHKARRTENKDHKIWVWCIAGIVILASLFSAYVFYQQSIGTANGFAPNVYTQQWQQAMGWVRENTSKDAVFGHWWDYGYWIQSMGDRATVLDGGNSIPYWNYLMGRYALTGSDYNAALEFLYSHNTTHFLIDSTDIGKYAAFSSIGSDEKYDRASWIPTMVLDKSQMQERKNSTVFVYSGGTVLDQDIIYDLNGTRLFLPANKAGIGAVIVERNSQGTIESQPRGVYVYNNQQYVLPMRYFFDNGKLRDFGSGVENGLFPIPLLVNGAKGQQLEDNGAALYLSPRTVKTIFAKLFLYNEDNPYYELVHTQDDVLVSQLKAQNYISKDISFIYDNVYGGGVRGPIRIWEIHYPSGMKVNPEYVRKDYPESLLGIAR